MIDEQIKDGEAVERIDIHHMPNFKYMESRGVPKDESICMKVERHRHIEIHKELRSIDPRTSERDALAKSVLCAKKVYEKSGTYNTKIRNSLRAVIEKNKKEYPNLFELKNVDNK